MHLDIAYTQHRGNNAYPQQDALWTGLRCVQQLDLKPECMQIDTDDWFVAVADGVAVSPSPHLSSRFVLERMAEEREESIARAGTWRLDGASVRRVHGRLCDRYGKGRTRGSSTTLAAVQLSAGRCVAVNSGDSRIYRISATGEWQQLSRDHTVLQMMIDEGRTELGTEYASFYDGLDACLSADDEEDYFSIYCNSFEWRKGDRLLLCTDGVHDVLGDVVLRNLYREEERSCGQVDAWRKAVIGAGAPDNFSIVFIKQ